MSFHHNNKSAKFNRDRHFNKKGNRGTNTSFYQPPSGGFPYGASNREHANAPVLEYLLEGSGNEEFNFWHNEFLNAELNKAGLQDYYSRHGAPVNQDQQLQTLLEIMPQRHKQKCRLRVNGTTRGPKLSNS